MDVIGVDIGGTKCAVVHASGGAPPIEIKRFPTATVRATLDEIFDTIASLRPGPHPAFGVSCGGPLDAKAGVILSPPNLPGWDRIPIAAELTERFGGEAYLMNDANAGALAEWKYGAGRGFRNVVFFTFGTGMGAGLILDGRLYEGTSGYAGEAGHIRLAPDGPVGFGKAGSFEGLCSGGGIAQVARARAGELGLSGAVTAKDVVAAAEAGNRAAAELLAEVGRNLGRGLAVVIDLLNPEVVVLGSLYVRAGRYLERTMREVLQEEALARPLDDCRILPAALGEQIGNYAAVAVARYRRGEFAE